MIYAGDVATIMTDRTIDCTASTLEKRASRYLIIVLLWN